MSKDWTPDELAAASKGMKAAGHMSYDEFCIVLENGDFAVMQNLKHSNQLEPVVNGIDNNS